jgi:hypothetical protein
VRRRIYNNITAGNYEMVPMAGRRLTLKSASRFAGLNGQPTAGICGIYAKHQSVSQSLVGAGRCFASSGLTHVDASTNFPKMVDVSEKLVTNRFAKAQVQY